MPRKILSNNCTEHNSNNLLDFVEDIRNIASETVDMLTAARTTPGTMAAQSALLLIVDRINDELSINRKPQINLAAEQS